MHDCEPYVERLNDTCVTVLTDYNKASYEKNIATQELYHVRGRQEDKKLKVTMLEKDLLLEKNVRLLSETQLDITLNQRDLARKEIAHLTPIITKLFNESEAIENLVNNGTVDNTYNWGWSNGYSTDENSPHRFDANRLYVPPDRTFHYPVNEKTFPEDIRCHFDKTSRN